MQSVSKITRRIAAWIAEGRRHQICTINPGLLMEARRNAGIAAVAEAADANASPDGVGLL